MTMVAVNDGARPTSGSAKVMGRGITARYAALGFVTKALTLPLVSYLPPAYAQATGLSLAAIGLLFMVARLWDIALDPLAGYLIDRIDPPYGPRKFWIALAAIVMLVAIPPVFAPALFGLGRGGDIAGPAAMLLIFYFGWTIVSVAHAAWAVDLVDTTNGRLRLIAWREWAGVLGMLAIVSAPALVEQVWHRKIGDQLIVMGAFAMIALPIALAATLRLPTSRRSAGLDRPDPLAAFRLLRSSSALVRLLLADLLSGSGFAIISATAYFILDRYLGLGASFSMLMLVYFIGLLLGVPLFLRLAVRAGPSRSFGIAMIGAACATLSIALVPHGALLVAAIVQFVTGIFTGGYQSNLNAAMAVVADRHDARIGGESKGTHFALLALTNKLGYALSIGICYPLLGVGGRSAPISGGILLLVIGLGGAATCLLLGAAAFVGTLRELD